MKQTVSKIVQKETQENNRDRQEGKGRALALSRQVLYLQSMNNNK
ncbi:MAG: hypothetical protein WCB31_01445 [Nitrososphaeraceae archaeon]